MIVEIALVDKTCDFVAISYCEMEGVSMNWHPIYRAGSTCLRLYHTTVTALKAARRVEILVLMELGEAVPFPRLAGMLSSQVQKL